MRPLHNSKSLLENYHVGAIMRPAVTYDLELFRIVRFALKLTSISICVVAYTSSITLRTEYYSPAQSAVTGYLFFPHWCSASSRSYKVLDAQKDFILDHRLGNSHFLLQGAWKHATPDTVTVSPPDGLDLPLDLLLKDVSDSIPKSLVVGQEISKTAFSLHAGIIARNQNPLFPRVSSGR